MRLVLLPQASRVMVPALISQLVVIWVLRTDLWSTQVASRLRL